MFGRRGAKADIRWTHERGAGPHTDLVPFGQEELDHRSPTVSCGTCHENLHDASLELLRAAIVSYRNSEMKDRQSERGQCVYCRSTGSCQVGSNMLMPGSSISSSQLTGLEAYVKWVSKVPGKLCEAAIPQLHNPAIGHGEVLQNKPVSQLARLGAKQSHVHTVDLEMMRSDCEVRGASMPH